MKKKIICAILACMISFLSACGTSITPLAQTVVTSAVTPMSAIEAATIPAAFAQPLSQGADYIQGAQMFDEQQALEFLEYLASDDLEGRRAGTRGGRAAGDYIANRFEKYGLQPAGTDGTYFQPFIMSANDIWDVSPILTVFFPSLDVSSNGELTRDYNYFTDYLPMIQRNFGSGEVKAPVVWIGTCNSYKLDASLSKQIVLCQPSETTDYDALVTQALDHRIGGLLVIYDDEGPGPFVRRMFRNGRLTELPAFWIPSAIVQDLLDGTEYTLDDLSQLPGPTPLATTVKMAVSIQKRELEARNVLGLLPGSDPQHKDEIVVISAHYDHVGRNPDGTVYNGANDNASGVAVMLEIARLWQEQGFKPARSVLFVAWDGEERGWLGSTYYVENPVYPLDHTVAMLNLDMAGVGEDLYIFGEEGSAVVAKLQSSAQAFGITATFNPEGGGSDEIPFMEAGVPAGAYFVYPDSDVGLAYHMPGDDIQNIQLDSLRKVGVCSAHFLAAWSGGGIPLQLSP